MKKRRNENQNYDAWLHWDVTKRCNLDCEYCFGKITDASIKVHPIKIDELLSTLDKTDKIFRISFTGGEPTMVPNFVEACKALSAKHYISFNSNLITKNVTAFANEINPDRVLHIHASFHYDELLRKNLLAKFFLNYNHLRDNGFNIYAEAVAYLEFKENLPTIKKFAEENFIKLNFAPYYGSFNHNNYPESYSNEDLKLFSIRQSDISCYAQKGELCNAGHNVAVVFSNGNVYPCHQIKTKIGNIYEEINFNNSLVNCPSKKCGCPLNKYDEYLFEKVLSSTSELN